MEFYKETIMGQVLTQVHSDKSNEPYFEKIDNLLDSITNLDYLYAPSDPWQKKGLFITNMDITKIDIDSEWTYVETADINEYSWLVEQLMSIYKPKITDTYRLLTTIGYLLNIYGDKYDNLTELFRITTVTSTVFLHPDHIGLDRFKVQPLKLPSFGKEF